MAFSSDLLFEGKWPFYKHLKSGKHQYLYYDGSADWDNIADKLKCGYENPVLLPILQLISFYASKAVFEVKNAKGEVIPNHKLTERIENPNIYQSKQDLISQFIWFKYCIGYTYMYPILPTTFKKPEYLDALFNLDASLIEWPQNFKTRFVTLPDDVQAAQESTFKYDKNGQNLNISVNEIIPFYDLPNGLKSKNLLIAPSRLDGLKKPLTNIRLAFDAKNIAIKTNGKEMFSNKTASQIQAVPLGDEEEKEIREKTNNEYGLGMHRSRSIVTNADIAWQSLHIPLKELGLDESVVKDAQMIVTAFNISRELINFGEKGAKYENQVQATIGFIQGVVQDNIDDICNSITSFMELKPGEKLVGSLDHLPIMQSVKVKMTEALKKKIETFKLMVDSGIKREDALLKLQLEGLTLEPIPAPPTNTE